MIVGTGNVWSMNQGILDIMKREMERIDVNLLGNAIWNGRGCDTSSRTIKRCIIVDKMLRDGTVWLSYVQTKYEDGIQP